MPIETEYNHTQQETESNLNLWNKTIDDPMDS